MILSDGESHKQPAVCICATQHVIPCFARRVSSIRSKDERCIEENLLAFAIGDLVEIPVLVTIRFIPLKSDTIRDDTVHDGYIVPQPAQFDKRSRKSASLPMAGRMIWGKRRAWRGRGRERRGRIGGAVGARECGSRRARKERKERKGVDALSLLSWLSCSNHLRAHVEPGAREETTHSSGLIHRSAPVPSAAQPSTAPSSERI